MNKKWEQNRARWARYKEEQKAIKRDKLAKENAQSGKTGN